MDFPGLGQDADETLVRARERARARGLEHPEGPDILLALLDSKQAIRVLELFDDEPEKVRVALGFMTRAATTQTDADAEQRTVDLARAEAGRLEHQETGADHLLLALVREQGSVAGGLLWSLGLTLDAARGALLYAHGEVSHWERPADAELPSRVTAWAPMAAVPVDALPGWDGEPTDLMDSVMTNLEVGLERLDRVIGIGQAVELSEIVVELIALEVRETGGILHWRTQTGEERLLGSPQITAGDDAGTTYHVFPMSSSGGGRESRGEVILTPRPSDAARTMLIEVRSFEDAVWMAAPFDVPSRMDEALGPWRFEIPLRP